MLCPENFISIAIIMAADEAGKNNTVKGKNYV
jgi:hypothetical protein